MKQERDVDVVIVGAGPAGSTTARFAAEAGLDVLVLERRPVIGEPVRCGELMPDVKEIQDIFPGTTDLDSLFDVPRDMVSQGFDTIRIFSPKMRRYEVPFSGYTTDRDRLDRFFAQQAVDAGAEIMTGQRCYGTKDGKVMTDDLSINAKVVVGADGPLSVIAKSYGLDRSKDLCPAVTVQIKGEFDPIPEMYFGTVAPGGYAWVIPKAGAANVGLGVSRKFAKGTVGEYFDRFLEMKHLTSEKPDGKFVPMSGPIRRTVAGNALVVGDAAGQVMAVNGGGIPIARICGRTAGKAIAAHLNDSRPLLAYDDMWRREVYKPLRTAARSKVLAELCFGSSWRLETAMRFIGERRMNKLIRCKPMIP